MKVNPPGPARGSGKTQGDLKTHPGLSTRLARTSCVVDFTLDPSTSPSGSARLGGLPGWPVGQVQMSSCPARAAHDGVFRSVALRADDEVSHSLRAARAC
ncbi:hypothetical protein ACTVH1_17875 [Gluconobacter cerinus]